MSDPTVVISRSGQDVPDRRAFESALIQVLVSSQVPGVLVVPSIYWLKEPGPALQALKDIPGGLVVAAWLYPRATYWILRYQGIDGQWSSQPLEQQSSKHASPRAIHCLNLADFPSPQACSTAILRACGRLTPSKTQVTSIDLNTPPRWYPVMDSDSCVDCKQCHDFCLFGVYELDPEGHVRVANPDSCKDGCPACSRICPAGAIIFPEYDADPCIAGNPDAGPPRPDKRRGQDQPESSSADELDQLIDELDELDE